jgi:hypothetical protein
MPWSENHVYACLSLGTWYGIVYLPNGDARTPMTSFTVENENWDGKTFHTLLLECQGRWSWTCVVEGRITIGEDGIPNVCIDVRLPDDNSQGYTYVCDGRLDADEGSIRGNWRYNQESFSGEFVFKRSMECMLFYPGPVAVRANPARARWNFALTAVCNRIKKNLWSTSFFADRFRVRKLYMCLAIRHFHAGTIQDPNLLGELWSQLSELYKSLTPADARFYSSLINYDLEPWDEYSLYVWNQFSEKNPHLLPRYFRCDSCYRKLGYARIICMDCRCDDIVGFCDDVACASMAPDADKTSAVQRPHLPGHEVFKVNVPLHFRYFQRKEKLARKKLNEARKLLSLDSKATETNSESAEEKPGPTCSYCKKQVFLSPPCWTCTECGGHRTFFCSLFPSSLTCGKTFTDELYICDRCEWIGLAFNEKHDRSHAVVLCKPAAQDLSTEKRLLVMEDRLVSVEDRLTKIEIMLHDALVHWLGNTTVGVST